MTLPCNARHMDQIEEKRSSRNWEEDEKINRGKVEGKTPPHG